MAKYIERVNRTRVTAKLLAEIVQMHATMPAEDRAVFEARALRMFELLKGKGFGTAKIAALSTAIDFRLTALARLERETTLHGWVLPGREPGVVSISLDLLKAAAVEPMIEDAEGRAAFDRESFHRRVLAGAEAEGRA